VRLLIAKIFRFLFTIRFFRKRYYGIIFRIIKPLNLFKGVTQISSYDRDLKIKLDLDEWIQQHIYFLGYFDPLGIRFIKNQLYEGEIFIDIGANVGAYSLIASRFVGKSGRVIAFEPASKSFLRLMKNISMNGLTNIIPERKAVIDRNTKIDLYISRNQNLGMSSIFHHDLETGTTESVEAVSLDSYAEKLGLSRISLIKIDIEGSEFLALKGMQKILDSMRPKILIELKEETLANSGFQVKDVLDLLTKAGYSKFIIDSKGNISNDLSQQPEDYHNFIFLPVAADQYSTVNAKT
jgi:FkbM family methyltransferase